MLNNVHEKVNKIVSFVRVYIRDAVCQNAFPCFRLAHLIFTGQTNHLDIANTEHNFLSRTSYLPRYTRKETMISMDEML